MIGIAEIGKNETDGTLGRAGGMRNLYRFIVQKSQKKKKKGRNMRNKGIGVIKILKYVIGK
jgi:hypothetical protein